MSFISNFAKACSRSFAAAGVLFFMFSGQAHAVDGCKVLLCLAGNWSNISQCRPDVEEALRQVERGQGLPSCEMAGAGNVARVVSSYYDPCPDGTTALAPGLVAVQGATYVEGTPLGTGIGSGDDQVPNYGGESGSGTPLPGKVCVGHQTGSQVVQITTGSGGGEGGGWEVQTYNVGLYDRVVFMDPLVNPRAIDVFVNSALYRRVRW